MLIILFVLGASNWEKLYYFPSGNLSKKIDKSATFEKNIENIRYIGKADSLIDYAIYEVGAWEPEILSFMRDSLKMTTKDHGVFLDIGAHTGQHSLYMAQYAKTVHAIEPYPLVLKRFHEMVSLNGFKNIKIYPVGFSNKDGSFTYYAPPDDSLGAGSFDQKFYNRNIKSMELPLVIGDNYLGSRGVNQIDLIKIDIEGYERFALLGLNNMLKKNRPIIVMELNASEGGFKSKPQLLETFPQDYSFFYLRKHHWEINLGTYKYIWGPIFKYDLQKYDYSFRKQANLAAIPNEKLALIMADK